MSIHPVARGSLTNPVGNVRWRWVPMALIVLAFGSACTGRAALGAQVGYAPKATPGDGTDPGVVTLGVVVVMGIGWSPNEEHALVPEARMMGGGALADDPGGLLQGDLGVSYTWLPDEVGLRAAVFGGAGAIVREAEPQPDDASPMSDDAASESAGDSFLYAGVQLGTYIALTDRGRSGGGKGGFFDDPDRTTSGIAASVGVANGTPDVEGPWAFLEVTWELVTFDE